MVSNPTAISLAFWLSSARNFLAEKTTTPYLEAQALASFVFDESKEWVISHSELILTQHQKEKLDDCLNQLLAGVPLAYITGFQEFYNLSFHVTPKVLIPRPETELLVEHAVHWANKYGSNILALDIGTGSGCISIALARHCPNVHLIALDRDFHALRVAKDNVFRNSLQYQISLVQSDLLLGINGKFEMLLANPPYIPTQKLLGLNVARFEPHLALDGGEDGLIIIRDIIRDAPRVLVAGGLFLMEIESNLGAQVKSLAIKSFPDSHIQIIPDYAGLPRLLKIIL